MAGCFSDRCDYVLDVIAVLLRALVEARGVDDAQLLIVCAHISVDYHGVQLKGRGHFTGTHRKHLFLDVTRNDPVFVLQRHYVRQRTLSHAHRPQDHNRIDHFILFHFTII